MTVSTAGWRGVKAIRHYDQRWQLKGSEDGQE